MFASYCLIVYFCIFVEIFAQTNYTTTTLEKYNVDSNSVTVSGISSGGAMSNQFHFIFSDVIKGAGIFEGGPYLCAYVSVLGCAPDFQLVPLYNLEASMLSKAGKISPVQNIKGQKVYIFHGTNDKTIGVKSGRNLKKMYDHFGADVHAEFSLNAGHGQPVDGNGYGGPCESVNPDQHYINECGYNGAYEMFSWLYGAENITRPPKGYVADGNIIYFNQTEFLPTTGKTSMSSTGLLYVPKGCADKTKMCRFHVAFHGCSSNIEAFGTDYVTKTQYAEVAELNDIVILFPQTANTDISPKGCWDFIGYTDRLTYPTKTGPQAASAYRMLQRVLGN
ncbi:uncharacterized protein LOC110850332 [Folsomia candida]|uniref:Poly(3-hydroxyalkanoate) depolymerase C n=1 Tax=Folsomia candida TaxID=158441 RepID=A0A226ECK6_FOLCA|nr:uncharacterized protein LOC110850332 [Folsomia candida]OXA54777.1 Poly(3-hydroxyalkanoate) depolymerase C [Folsomia candida]